MPPRYFSPCRSPPPACGAWPAEPITDTRKLPGSIEVPRIFLKPRRPDRRRLTGAGEILALGVEPVGLIVRRDGLSRRRGAADADQNRERRASRRVAGHARPMVIRPEAGM